MPRCRRAHRRNSGSDSRRSRRARIRSAGASCRSIRTPQRDTSSSRLGDDPARSNRRGGDAVNDALVIARLVHFAAAMTAFGASAFRFYAVGRLPLELDEGVVARFDLWSRALLWISGLTMLLSGIAIVPFVAAR